MPSLLGTEFCWRFISKLEKEHQAARLPANTSLSIKNTFGFTEVRSNRTVTYQGLDPFQKDARLCLDSDWSHLWYLLLSFYKLVGFFWGGGRSAGHSRHVGVRSTKRELVLSFYHMHRTRLSGLVVDPAVYWVILPGQNLFFKLVLRPICDLVIENK